MVRLGRIDKHLLVLPHNSMARIDVLKTLMGASGTVLTAHKKEIETLTRLFVFEELRIVSRALKAALPKNLPPSVSSINPSLFLSRIPKDDDKAVKNRGVIRLAREVCEIVGRLMNDDRVLTTEDSSAKIISTLNNKVTRLSDIGQVEWANLCERLIGALKAK